MKVLIRTTTEAHGYAEYIDGTPIGSLEHAVDLVEAADTFMLLTHGSASRPVEVYVRTSTVLSIEKV